MVKIVLKSGKDQAILRFHPWIFSGAIKKTEGKPAEGDLVEVYSDKNDFLALGHYQVGSIAVRIVSFVQVDIDYAFWRSKLYQAYKLRQDLGLTENPETNVYNSWRRRWFARSNYRYL